MNVNRVILAGNLTRDPEMRYTSKGQPICRLGLATTRRWKNQAGEVKEDTVFVDVEAFGAMAENLSKYFSKGRRIYLEGRLKLDQWQDAKTKANRQKIGVVCESFQFVDRKEKDWKGKPVSSPEPGEKDETDAALPTADDDVPF